MDYKKLLDEIINNGGGSYNKDLRSASLKEGYMCSIIGLEKTYILKDIYKNKEVYNKLINDIKEYQKRLLKNNYIGFWTNGDLLYLDISKHYKNKRTAIAAGIKNKQLAIWDLKNNNNIDILKNTYIIYEYNKIKNDYIYINEYNSIKNIESFYNLSDGSGYNYSIKSIDDPIGELINNKYIILIDKIYINEI